MKTLKLLLLTLVICISSCSLFEQECINGYYYDFVCIFPNYNTYHDGSIHLEEFYTASQAAHGLKDRCYENGATEIQVTCYRVYCGNISTDPLYKETIQR